MAFTIQEVRQEFLKVCKEAKVELVVDISINSRLKRTLGRVGCNIDVFGVCKPSKVEFNKAFLEQATNYEIVQVIKHEAAHYIAVMRTKEHHGHDTLFRKICKEIGCEFNGTVAPLETKITNSKKEKKVPTKTLDYKYEVYCLCCGEVVDRKKRMCKMLKEIEYYQCQCGGSLEWRTI